MHGRSARVKTGSTRASGSLRRILIMTLESAMYYTSVCYHEFGVPFAIEVWWKLSSNAPIYTPYTRG